MLKRAAAVSILSGIIIAGILLFLSQQGQANNPDNKRSPLMVQTGK